MANRRYALGLAVVGFLGFQHEPHVNAQTGVDEIVLYASDIQESPLGWVVESDATAAENVRVHDPNGGAAKVTQPVASPSQYFDISFNADGGKPYRLWLRLKADANNWANDSVWVQFSDTVNTSGSGVYRIGTASGTSVNLEEGSGVGVAGWGWQDDAYGAGVQPAIPIVFAATGTHTIRIQRREDGVMVDQIVLSAVRYRNSAPGLAKNDTTIVSKPGAANQAPTITAATANRTSGPAPLAVTFNVSATDPEGEQPQYSWNFGDGATGTGAGPSHTYSTAGNYSAVVTASDSHGASDSQAVGPITVSSTNAVPVKFFHFNTHHGRSPNGANNLEDVTRLIHESGAQVVSLNEVELKRGGYVYNGAPEDQPKRIEDMLESKTGRCWAQLRAPRDGDTTATQGVQVNLLLWQTNEETVNPTCDDSRGFQLVETRVHLLPDDPETGRSVGAATLVVNNRNVTFMTTHLTYCDCAADGGAAARTEQVKDLLDFSTKFPAANQQIIGGDFNIHDNQSQYTRMTGADTPGVPDDAFADAWKDPNVTKIPTGYTGNTADGKRIDYFLRLRKSTQTVTKSFEVKEAAKRQDSPTVLVSDHYPLIAVFEIK